MQFPTSHIIEQKLKSISERLLIFGRNTNSYNSYNDSNIKSQNLKLHLSFTLAHIIQNLEFVERSKSVFEKVINDYNSVHNTNLIYDDLEKISWIRFVKGEVIIPEIIRRFISKVSHSNGEVIEIPTGKDDILKCLQIYYKNCFTDSKLTITKEKLDAVLSDYAKKEITTDFLISNKIIHQQSSTDNYNWEGGEYIRHLKNEIAATLWLLIGSPEATLNEFKKYFKLLQGVGIWIDNLEYYLNKQNTDKICELAVTYLNEETDLIRTDKEFAKIWLDTATYLHIEINNEIPKVELNYENTFAFIESINYYERIHQDIFDHQQARSYCLGLLRLIINNAPKYQAPYQSVLNILLDTSRPFLVWSLYQEIPRDYPEVIPYLLTNSELTPIALQLIDNIQIDNILLSEQSNNDKKFEECCELKNKLWLEMFDLSLEQLEQTLLSRNSEETGAILSKILIDVANKVFTTIRVSHNNNNVSISHYVFKERYDSIFLRLNSKRKTYKGIYPKPLIIPRFIFDILPDIFEYIKNCGYKFPPFYNEFLHLNSGLVDLSIEILRLCKIPISENEILPEQKQKIEATSIDIISVLKDYLLQYYTSKEIKVLDYITGAIISKVPKRGVNEFGFEIIDWGYLYLHFQEKKLLSIFNTEFNSSLDFKTESDKYNEQNREQLEKIKLYLKSIMIAYISINKKRDSYEIEGLPVKETLEELGGFIKNICLIHSTNDLTNNRIDVFDETFSVFGSDIYYQRLTTLLYTSVNCFTEEAKVDFINKFFFNSIDIGRMLTAINILDSKVLTKQILDLISSVNLDEYIKSVSTVTELQHILIQAVNSESSWNLSSPLIDRIQAHYKRVGQSDENTNIFLFEINLLLAFKEKDFKKLISLPVPVRENYFTNENEKGENTKQFYIALFKLYNDEDYNESIKTFESLLSKNTKNIRYAYHLLKAKTLIAIKNKTNLTSLQLAYKEWEDFIATLENEEKRDLENLFEAIESNNIYLYTATENYTKFDQTINRLSNRFLFSEDIIELVYKCYIDRDLHELAFDYLNKAKKYYDDNDDRIPPIISSLREQYPDEKMMEKLKLILGNLSSQKFTDIPKILPNNLNGYKSINEFILAEIIMALKVLRDKIVGVKDIKNENSYNDLMLASLRLRLPLWGWCIFDQPRLGRSPKRKDAGEIDHLIQAGGSNIGLIEALILKGKNKSKTQQHILKCNTYANNLTRFYIVVYYKGKLDNLESTWDSYKLNVISTKFTDDIAIDKAKNFIDLSGNYNDIRNFKVAITYHSNKTEMFHIMINLGE